MNLELLGIYTSFGILQSYDQVQRIELSINSMCNARYDTIRDAILTCARNSVVYGPLPMPDTIRYEMLF